MQKKPESKKLKNMKTGGIFIGLFLSQFSFASDGVEGFPNTMTVITSNDKPVKLENSVRDAFALRGIASNFHVYNLDHVEAFETELSRDLPANESLAREMVKQRIATMGQHTLEKNVANAYRGLTTAMHYNIQQFPAVIFDEQYLVLGVSDLSYALEQYRSYMLKHAGE